MLNRHVAEPWSHTKNWQAQAMQNDSNQVSLLARTNARESHRTFGIKQVDRLSHMYVIGKTGVGKIDAD